MEPASTESGVLKRRTFLSPAKVNIFLKVRSKRPDGYHEIYSLMQPVSLYDVIEILLTPGALKAVRCKGYGVPEGRENLACRAAEAFLERTGIAAEVEIFITKNIPIGAGLGGGSSDAAGVLLGLNSMTGQGLAETELMELGALIGSDVPFFILKGPAIASGRGEILKRVKTPRCHYVLVNPSIHVSTQWAYSNLDLTKKAKDNTLTYSEAGFSTAESMAGILENDLEAVTAVSFPEIGLIKEALVEYGALGALMSGSGSTVFGVFSEEARAEAAFELVSKRFGGSYSVYLAQGL
ncbi:MAG: 4-(cytidine 5'-diphospho)-2-C-methyl-D-erythritol kinase [Deltaproteobacteria bacterium]